MAKKRRTWFVEFTVQYLMKQGWQPTKVEYGWGEDEETFGKGEVEKSSMKTVPTKTFAEVVLACRRAGMPKFAHEAVSIWFVHEQHGQGDVLFIQQEFWVLADWGAQTNPPPTKQDMAKGNFHSHETYFNEVMRGCSDAEDKAWAEGGGGWRIEAIPL